MFESIELGHKLAKNKFKELLPKLRAELLQAHLQLQGRNFPVIVIIAGEDAAGKGETAQRLNEWLDPHGVETHAFWESSKEKRQRPEYWRFWQAMPGRGRIGIFFGSWYAEPMLRRISGKIKSDAFDHALDRIAAFEKMLTDDGALVLKFWLHLSRKDQKNSLKALDKKGLATQTDWNHHKLYDSFIKIAERAISRTHDSAAPWHLVEAADERYRVYTVAKILQESLQQKLDTTSTSDSTPKSVYVKARETGEPGLTSGTDSILDKIDLTQELSDSDYRKQIAELQTRLGKLAWKAHSERRSMVLVFEGWDAAGKGGAICRVVQSMDPRLYKVVGVAAPTDEERAQHYLWRFWRNIPRAGSATIFDRSWYGRILVERVEGFAPLADWSRAYTEINAFEEQLVEHGIILRKFWLHISPEEQLRRFKEREQIAYKQYKITEEDWRNRKKWDEYKLAVNEMVARCSTDYAPWTLVAANDKRIARAQVLKTVVNALER